MIDEKIADEPTAEEWVNGFENDWSTLQAFDIRVDRGAYKCGYYDGAKWMREWIKRCFDLPAEKSNVLPPVRREFESQDAYIWRLGMWANDVYGGTGE